MISLTKVIEIITQNHPNYQQLGCYDFDESVEDATNIYYDLQEFCQDTQHFSDFDKQIFTLENSQQPIYYAYRYLYTMVELMSAIAGDGLFSIFYNHHEDLAINTKMIALTDEKLAQKFQEVCVLLAENIKNQEYDTVTEAQEDFIEAVDDYINSHWNEIWQHIFNCYQLILKTH